MMKKSWYKLLKSLGPEDVITVQEKKTPTGKPTIKAYRNWPLKECSFPAIEHFVNAGYLTFVGKRDGVGDQYEITDKGVQRVIAGNEPDDGEQLNLPL